MKAFLISALVLGASQSASASPAVSPRCTISTLFCAEGAGDPNYCWVGYQGKKFTGTHITNCVDPRTCCVAMAASWETTKLFSAKVTRGNCNVYLYTDYNCKKGRQLIDHAGYRGMTYLPAYRSWSTDCYC